MAAIGWIWACLMVMAGLRAHLGGLYPRDLVIAMLLSGGVALPLFWNRKTGLFATIAPSGIVRAGLAILILVIAGISHPDAVMGLLPGLLPRVS